MTTPVLYLDVDGAICPARTPDEYIDDFGDWEIVPGSTLTPWSPSLVAAVTALPVELRWLTSWEHEANRRLSPLFGWEQLPVLGWTPDSLWWKFDALIEYHEPGVPFIWIDDELDDRRQALGTAFEVGLNSLGAPYICISPWTHRGITRIDLARVVTFCENFA
jgi:hypothetical protein